jgi:hypothetical protein
MFDEEFYPTSRKLIEKMLEDYKETNSRFKDYNLQNLTILDPSAGKGDILDFISKQTNRDDLYCIESDPELQHILRSKGYQLIADDFLNYSGEYYFDLILMNPPFSKGVDHFLKAWNILTEGNIVCLLNAETINNPCTAKRKTLESIINYYGSVEIIEKPFSDAERKTNVNVALVKITKQSNQNDFDFQFQNKTNEEAPEFSEENIKNQIAINDIIGNLLIQYDETKKAFVNYIKARKRLEFYSKDLLGQYESIVDIADKSFDKYEDISYKNSYNRFISRLKKSAWHNILKKTNIERYMTSAVQKNFQEFSQHQGSMDLTKENIYSVIQMLFENRDNILQQAVESVFDLFTMYHEENRIYFEGWKTNNSWKVNRKVVLPQFVRYGEYMDNDHLRNYGAKFKVNIFNRERHQDIDKALCYISGKSFETIKTIGEALEFHFDQLGDIKTGESFDNTCESTFFKIKFYKKGTVHLYFKDKKLWEQFNIIACQAKSWLPPSDNTNKQNEQKDEKQLMLL